MTDLVILTISFGALIIVLTIMVGVLCRKVEKLERRIDDVEMKTTLQLMDFKKEIRK